MVAAILCCVQHDGQVLLIRKKRGFGAGKITLPGGKREPGESPEAAAAREVQEELGIAVRGVQARGFIEFFFGQEQEPDWSVHVLSASEFSGIPVETAEASPLWVRADAVPYAEMWADDTVWMPLLLAGTTFVGKFYYDKDVTVMLRYELSETPLSALQRT